MSHAVLLTFLTENSVTKGLYCCIFKKGKWCAWDSNRAHKRQSTELWRLNFKVTFFATTKMLWISKLKV